MSSPATMTGMAKSLRELAEDAGMAPKDVAESMGIGRNAVGFWFQGRNRPLGSRIRTLADLLGVSTDDIRAALDESARRRDAGERA